MEKNELSQLLSGKRMVLDTVGSALLFLGFAKYFVGLDVIPPSLLFDGYPLVFMGLGVVMMLPILLGFLGYIREKTESTRL